MKWSSIEEEKLKKYYPRLYTDVLIDKYFNKRTLGSIHRKAQRLGLHKKGYYLYKEAKSKLNREYPFHMTPHYIVGFTDGEGSFYITGKGFPRFDICNTHKHTLDMILKYFIDKKVLRPNKKYLRDMRGVWHIEVRAPIDLFHICYFFMVHPLLTKQNQFYRWKNRLMEMNKKWVT